MKSFIKTIGVFTGAILLMISCDDQLDQAPIGFLSDENTFETLENLQQGLNGAYARATMQEHNIRFDIITDEVKIGAESGGQSVDFYNFNLNSQSREADSLWRASYALINQVNRVLDGVETVELQDGQEAALRNIRGQLFGLRAYAHWELLQWFATSYTDGAALAVPYVDFVVTIEELPRNTVSEVLAGIENDLSMARDLVAASNGVEFVNPDMLTALEARIKLYTGEYAQAGALAGSLIQKYPLADRDAYTAMFGDTDNTEVIFKLRRTAADFAIGEIWYFNVGGGPFPFLEMSNGLFDRLDPDDVRYDVNFWAEVSAPADNSHLIGKYRNPGFVNDLKVFRVSEMYLIQAEAAARQGNLTDAAQTLKQLRDARFGSDTTPESFSSPEEAVVAILDERRIELAFEGHRYLDIRRTRELTGTGINRDPRDCQVQNCELPVSDYRFNPPVPLAELVGNDNMEQNPGYGS
ncbi:RagB/SusD family nutrient uptake outer membrane protein [Robiginitalea sp. SC105]|uniref:RagB/SusD family nutrient uptake outer membrane protein n=1 Tax=Robiginitalea sp. SC105 TaxID=2762332 RepID=UPI00163AACC2|nr:RagB/SusD family nutrient uptake outer membrane protein [Robiginitalea sp. SC105]MBC2838313.1 RagB/SusD family nutrient uptake outer membrane protein [Robiginitalea sp. SC105]